MRLLVYGGVVGTEVAPISGKEDLLEMTAPLPNSHPIAPTALRLFFDTHGQIRSLTTGDYLCWEGESADAFYRVEAGELELQIFAGDLGFITVSTLGPGDCLGWACLLPPYSWRLSARAASPSVVVACDADMLRTHCENNPRFGYEVSRFVLKLIASRIRATRRKLLRTS
jgi:CRP/FNR family transcriptional regulator, cyclic AMP receptor protein